MQHYWNAARVRFSRLYRSIYSRRPRYWRRTGGLLLQAKGKAAHIKCSHERAPTQPPAAWQSFHFCRRFREAVLPIHTSCWDRPELPETNNLACSAKSAPLPAGPGLRRFIINKTPPMAAGVRPLRKAYLIAAGRRCRVVSPAARYDLCAAPDAARCDRCVAVDAEWYRSWGSSRSPGPQHHLTAIAPRPVLRS